MPYGPPPLVGTLNSAITNPLVVIWPILLAPVSVNQRLPSGPAVMLTGRLLSVGIVNSSAAVMVPAVVIRPILLAEALREPEVAVWAGRDANGLTADCGRGELCQGAAGHVQTADLAFAGVTLCKPEIAIGTERDA